MAGSSAVPPEFEALLQRLQASLTQEERKLVDALLSQAGSVSPEDLLARAAAALGTTPGRLQALLTDPEEVKRLIASLADRAGPDAAALRSALEQRGLRLPPAAGGPRSPGKTP